MKRPLFVFVLFVSSNILLGSAFALPRFASRTGAKCQSCHVNPSGGGMRQAFGQQYGRETLPVPTWSEEFGLEDFSTKLTESISIGADFRTLYYMQQVPDSSGKNSVSTSAFWQMQGDMYLNFRLAKKVNIYLDKGIYSGFEIFGMLNILPGNGYLKLGKFVPNYGTKLDDHRTYIRQETGFSAERGRAELTGAEVGFNASSVNILGGVFNAADPFGGGGSKKAFLGRVDGIFKLNDEGTMNLGLGGNVFTKDLGGSTRMTLFGAIGSFSFNDFSIMGEVDWISNKVAGTTTKGIVTYVEADYAATPGLDIKVMYEFFDRDVDFKTGSQSRYSLGFEFFPISGVEVRPLYRFNVEDPTNVSNDEFNLLIHFYL